MATTNPLVNTLPAYVEQQRLPLIVKAVMGAKSAGLFTLQTGVKGPTAINLLKTNPALNTASCGWNDDGTNELTQRVINAKYLEVNMGFCDKNLFGKWAQSQIMTAADPKAMPFEEEFTESVVKGIAAEVEKMIWQGDGTGDSFKGVVNIYKDDVGQYIDLTAGTSAYEAIKKVYMALPAEVAQAEDAVIFVSDAIFRAYIQDLVSANQYHWTPDDKVGEYLLPGTACRVISVNGLNNASSTVEFIVGGALSNFFYGTDLVGDSEKIDLWYSKDNREFRCAVEWISGVQIAFPDQVKMARLTK